MRPPTIEALPRAAHVQLIITDVDGTLLDSRLGFPHTSPTYSVLRRIRSTHPDVPIVISTGKTIRAAAHLRRDLDLAPFPTCHLNGNLVYASTGEIIHESTLLLPVIEKVYETCRAAALSLCLFDRDRVYHVLPFGTISVEKANRLFRGYGEEIVELQEADDVMRRVRDGAINVISMAVCETSECLREARVLFENLQPLQLAVTQSMPFCLQLIPPSNDKGTALLAVVEHLNATRPPSARPITLDGVVAFGDGENDVPMFALAGMSVAMGNGMQAAKDRARWTTHTNDEGGVGTFLDRVFFPTDVEKAGL